MKVRNQNEAGEKIRLQMTPMIDIVFQLLVFFVMTFKVVAMEGDFNVTMPAGGQTPDTIELDKPLPLVLKMTANADGTLKSMSIDNHVVADMQSLRQYVHGYLGDERGPGTKQQVTEIELDCDYNLDYYEAIRAVTAVTGYQHQAGDRSEFIKLVEKVRLKDNTAKAPRDAR